MCQHARCSLLHPSPLSTVLPGLPVSEQGLPQPFSAGLVVSAAWKRRCTSGAGRRGSGQSRSKFYQPPHLGIGLHTAIVLFYLLLSYEILRNTEEKKKQKARKKHHESKRLGP